MIMIKIIDAGAKMTKVEHQLNDKWEKPAIKFFKSISVRVTILVIGILSIGIGITITYYLKSQNATVIESRESAIREEVNVLYLAIKNNMLAGEAPIAVELFRELARIEDIGDIRLYRANGISAFSDNSTLDYVNSYLRTDKFARKSSFLPRDVIDDENFKKAVKNVDDVTVQDVDGAQKKLIIYKTLINQPKCSRCHGLDHVIRGVIRISSPLDTMYMKTRGNLILSIVIYSIVVFILSLSIIYFINKIVIRRIYGIGRLVQGVGSGDFKTKIKVVQNDELGMLGNQINRMIDGLNEHFKLSKFVSKSTMDHIRSTDEIKLGGEKRIMTVLFTDIRGFTSYSESRDPDEIMKMLNIVMNMQAEIIDRHGGDIDKYVGDEIMATFYGEDMVLNAAAAAVEIKKMFKERFSEPGNEVHIGIGINTGEMISGNLGSGNRMDRTVIGDSVNVGSRLCSVAGKNVIVLSEYSYAYIQERVTVREHEPIKVKGKSVPVKIYILRDIV